jgi:hypothetical protein
MEFEGIQRMQRFSGQSERLMGNTGSHFAGKSADPVRAFPSLIDDQGHEMKKFKKDMRARDLSGGSQISEGAVERPLAVIESSLKA